MADATNPYDGSAATAILTPLERLLAAALLEHAQSAAKHGRETGPLAQARAVIHALARYLARNGAPVEMTDTYAVALACAALKGVAWCHYTALVKLGIGPHEALHTAIEEAAKGADRA